MSAPFPPPEPLELDVAPESEPTYESGLRGRSLADISAQITARNDIRGAAARPEPSPRPLPGARQQPTEPTGAVDVFRGLTTELGPAIVQGVLDATEELVDSTLETLAPLTGVTPEQAPFGTDAFDLFELRTDTGRFIKFTAQFLVGFIPILRATKALGIASGVARSIIAGSLADPLVIDEQEGRLSTLIQEFPALQNPVTEFLAGDPDDSVAELKLKQTLEGLAVGIGSELITKGFLSSVRVLGRARQAQGRPQTGELLEQVEQAERGELRLEDLDPTRRAAVETEQRVRQRTRETMRAIRAEESRPLVDFQDGETVGTMLRLERRITGRLDDLQNLSPADIRDARNLVNSINIVRLAGDEGTDSLRGLIRTFAEDLPVGRRESLDEVRALGESLGLDPERLIRTVRARDGFLASPGEAAGLRALLNATNIDVLATARDFQVARAAGEAISEADQIAFFAKIGFASELTSLVRGVARNFGRSLNSLRIPADSVGLQRFAIDQILETTSRDLDQVLARITSLGSVNKLGRLSLYLNRGKRAFTEAWVNSILSGPHTTMVNLFGNALIATLAVPERFMAATLRGIRGGQEGVSFREAAAFLHGTVMGTVDGFRLGFQALKTARPSVIESVTGASDEFLRSEIGTTRGRARAISAQGLGLGPDSFLGRAANVLGTVFNLPTERLLLPGDEFFKAIGYRAELHALAAREAQRLGRGASARELGRAAQTIRAAPPEHLVLDAVDAARMRTLQAPLGELAKRFQDATNRHFFWKFFFPFIRTPTNILKYSAVRSPVVAGLSSEFRAAIAAGGAQRDLALGQLAVGTLLATGVANLALAGRITGPGPSSGPARDAWFRAGWRPWSVLVPGPDGQPNYVSYNRLDPVGVTFGLAAGMTEIMGELEVDAADEAVASFMATLSAQVLNKTYLQTISNVLEALFEPNAKTLSARVGRFFGTSAASFVPFSSFFGQLQRGFDPELRNLDELSLSERSLLPIADLLSRLREETPSYSETLPARHNLFGEPIAYFGGFGPDNANAAIDPSFSYFNTTLRLVSPLNVQGLSRDAVDQEVLRLSSLELSVPFPPQSVERSIDGIPLTAAEQATFAQEAGRPAKQDISRILAGSSPLSAVYRSLNDAGKARLLSRLISSHRAVARARLRNSPRLIQARRDLALRQQAPGTATLGEAGLPQSNQLEPL